MNRSFPTNSFPSQIQPYRPPQALKPAHIAKIICGDASSSSATDVTGAGVFAALSSNGELFTFSVSLPTSTTSFESDALGVSSRSFGDAHRGDANATKSGGGAPRPQRVWPSKRGASPVRVCISPHCQIADHRISTIGRGHRL